MRANSKQIRIQNRWHIQQKKPCQLPGWMKTFYYSITARIRIPDLPYNMTIGKESQALTHEVIEAV